MHWFHLILIRSFCLMGLYKTWTLEHGLVVKNFSLTIQATKNDMVVLISSISSSLDTYRRYQLLVLCETVISIKIVGLKSIAIIVSVTDSMPLLHTLKKP